MPGDAELECIGIRIVVYPQDILAASVRAIRDALAELKGGSKPPMASPPNWQRPSGSPNI
jgi:2-methylisocitrate lyase-like PEP mutase family enzyme